MLNKEEFIDFILNGPEQVAGAPDSAESALPEGLEGFGFDGADTSAAESGESSFAKRLLEASGFGLPKQFHRDSVIRSSDAVARHLPERVSFWDKTSERPYRTLLFETDLDHKQLLNIPAFRNRQMAHLDIVEDALSRFVEEALKGFQQGGQSVTADVVQGRKEETLCVISIVDKREGEPVRLVCFGTYNANKEGGLETFRITEQTRSWEPHLAREHLGLLYTRQFKKLSGKSWQEAFTTSEERKQAQKLLQVCSEDLFSGGQISETRIQESILALLDTIAKGFGLRPGKGEKRRLRADQLPPDHDIGMEPETRENEEDGKNPFRGVTLRDEKSRLLGYIVYPLSNTTDAKRLRAYLKDHNRFHNVLVVYPDHDETHIELWQGDKPLKGKLRSGQGYKDAAEVVNLLSRFFVVSKAKVNNPPELAKELAFRARYLRSIALEQLEVESESGDLRSLHAAFKEALVHDQTEEEFADAFAQTLTYSLLTARWVLSAQGGKSGDRFTRKAAMKKLAIGSRFLSEMFTAVLSIQLENQNRLHWLVDDLTGLLDRVDVVAVFQDDGSDLTADPIIHFYEPFLQEYDSAIRMQRGVFYTPRPVVSYIVRSVDELLRTNFGLEDGLADTATWGDMVKRFDGLNLPDGVSPEQTFVQILDPATGTGTFLVEVIDVIHRTLVKKWIGQGHDSANVITLWNKYVPEQLLPRLYGYELMMAPYAVAHLKIGLKLHETNYAFGSETHTAVYLTNALELAQDFSGTFAFAIPALAHEASAVNTIKQDVRFTVVIANPPYAAVSSNLSETAIGLVAPYREFDGEPIVERGALQFEKNINDDYVKFIRFAESLVEKSIGVVGYISNNGYLESPTLRGMRQHLAETFPLIGIVDLHGDTDRREKALDGSADENVFDIKRGVAVALFVRPANPSSVSKVRHTDLLGCRRDKYDWLDAASGIECLEQSFTPFGSLFLFARQDEDLVAEYSSAVGVEDLFVVGSSGFESGRDEILLAFTEAELLEKVKFFAHGESNEVRNRFSVEKAWGKNLFDRRDTMFSGSKLAAKVSPVLMYPFDLRFCFYRKDLLKTNSWSAGKHLRSGNNLALMCMRQVVLDEPYSHICVSSAIVNNRAFASQKGKVSYYPLLLQPEDGLLEKGEPHANLRPDAVSRLMHHCDGKDAPWRVLHYLIAQTFSSSYRSRYVECLRRGFPRVFRAKEPSLEKELIRLGADLVGLLLLDGSYRQASWNVRDGMDPFSHKKDRYVGDIHPNVGKVSYSNQTIWLDKAKKCGFKSVPKEVWNFRMGGYQICSKWLTDRQAKAKQPARVLTRSDITHYENILVALVGIMRISTEIGQLIDGHGGWPDAFVTTPAGATK